MRYFVWLLSAVLVGCASDARRSPTPIQNPNIDSDPIVELRQWRADGRIAIQKSDQGWSARLRWIKDGDEFQLRLIAPLGRGTYQLAGNEDVIALALPDGRQFAAASAERLMERSSRLEHSARWCSVLVARDPSTRFACERGPAR